MCERDEYRFTENHSQEWNALVEQGWVTHSTVSAADFVHTIPAPPSSADAVIPLGESQFAAMLRTLDVLHSTLDTTDRRIVRMLWCPQSVRSNRTRSGW